MFVQLSTFVVHVFYNFEATNTQEKCRKRTTFSANLVLIESFFHIPKCRIMLQTSLKIQIIKCLFCNFIYYTLSELKRSLKMHIFMHGFCNNLFQIRFNKS